MNKKNKQNYKSVMFYFVQFSFYKIDIAVISVFQLLNVRTKVIDLNNIKWLWL